MKKSKINNQMKPKLTMVPVDKIQTPKFVKKYMSIPNSTDKYLPIERLERKGRKVMRWKDFTDIHEEKTDNIMVFVGGSQNHVEGFYTELGGVGRLLDKEELCYSKDDIDGLMKCENKKLMYFGIPINQITDYNSLWEMTKSGWNSKRGYWNNKQGTGIEGNTPFIEYEFFPYIGIDDGDGYELWRWDNPNLRLDMGILKWTEENHKRYKEEIFPQERQTWGRMIRQGEIEIPKTMGRNKPCICGSGVKFKKCCLTNNQVGVS